MAALNLSNLWNDELSSINSSKVNSQESQVQEQSFHVSASEDVLRSEDKMNFRAYVVFLSPRSPT